MAKFVKKSNLEALREAYENRSKGGRGFKFWKPKKFGRYLIRFLPPKDPDGLFFKETAQYKLGDNYFFAPYIEGEPDPVYEYYKALYKKGTDDAIALAKEIKPRKQYLYNIVVKEELGETSENPTEVQVYMSGKNLFETLMDYFMDDDYGDLTDVEDGYDFQLIKEQGDLGFPNYKKSKPKKNSSPLLDDPDQVEEVLKNIKDLDAEVDYKSYDELKEALDRFLNSQDDSENVYVPGSTTSSTNTSSSTSSESSSSKPKKEEKAEEEDEDESLDDFEKQLMAEIEED